jgi:hypothetical protein
MVKERRWIMGIHVVNKRTFEGNGIYIGRPSLLGNPFKMKSEADRERVIREYRTWLWERVKERGKVFGELVRIRKLAEREDVYLVCFCRPEKACHGDVITSCVEWMLRAGIE